jgi:hypothetical protein
VGLSFRSLTVGRGGNRAEYRVVAILLHTADRFPIDEALFLQTVLQNKQNPLPADLNCLRDWMEIPTRGYVYLLGADHDTWSKSPLEDLISLKRPEALSPVTQYLGRGFARNWMRCSRKTKVSSMCTNGTPTILRIVY